MSVRRSSRSAYKSLVELEKRAKAAEAAAQGPLWGEEAFADIEEDDESFDEENHSDDGEDIIDSDFDDPEEKEEPDEEVKAEKAVRVEERRAARKAKSGKYVDPALKKSVRKASGAPVEKRARTEVEAPTIHRSSLRRSTKIASLKAAEIREKRQQDEEERRRKKAAKKAEQPEERELTQEELLEEAKQTEVKNRESLKELLKLEEEKKRLPPPKKKVATSVLSTRSRGGKQTVSFTDKKVDARKEMFPQLYS